MEARCRSKELLLPATAESHEGFHALHYAVQVAWLEPPPHRHARKTIRELVELRQRALLAELAHARVVVVARMHLAHAHAAAFHKLNEFTHAASCLKGDGKEPIRAAGALGYSEYPHPRHLVVAQGSAQSSSVGCATAQDPVRVLEVGGANRRVQVVHVELVAPFVDGGLSIHAKARPKSCVENQSEVVNDDKENKSASREYLRVRPLFHFNE